jgi:hypothetical protein
VPLSVSPENENAPVASVVVFMTTSEGEVSVIDALAMPLDVNACTTRPFSVYGAVGAGVVVVVVDGADGLHAHTAHSTHKTHETFTKDIFASTRVARPVWSA